MSQKNKYQEQYKETVILIRNKSYSRLGIRLIGICVFVIIAGCNFNPFPPNPSQDAEPPAADMPVSDIQPAPSYSIYVKRQNIPASADFIAYRSNNGSWKIPELGDRDLYTMPLANLLQNGTLDIVVVCVNPDGIPEGYFHHHERYSEYESTSDTFRCEQKFVQAGTATLSGTVTGVFTQAQIFVGTDSVSVAADGSYEIQSTPGAHQMILRAMDNAGTWRSLTLPVFLSETTPSSQDLDFTQAVSGDAHHVYPAYFFDAEYLGSDIQALVSGTAVPLEQKGSEVYDYVYNSVAQTSDANLSYLSRFNFSQDASEHRTVYHFVFSPVDIYQWAKPARLYAPTFLSFGGLSFSWPDYMQDSSDYFVNSYRLAYDFGNMSWEVLWENQDPETTAMNTFQFPDLSGVDGWSPSWEPDQKQAFNWEFHAMGQGQAYAQLNLLLFFSWLGIGSSVDNLIEGTSAIHGNTAHLEVFDSTVSGSSAGI